MLVSTGMVLSKAKVISEVLAKDAPMTAKAGVTPPWDICTNATAAAATDAHIAADLFLSISIPQCPAGSAPNSGRAGREPIFFTCCPSGLP